MFVKRKWIRGLTYIIRTIKHIAPSVTKKNKNMKINAKEIANNSEQLKHFNPSARVRWNWLIDELQARTKYNRIITVLGHRYVVGVDLKL